MIKKLSEFIEEIEGLCDPLNTYCKTTTHWFRGQSNTEWDLLPSIYRGGINPDRERELIRDFQLRSNSHVQICPENKLEWMFIMQHHGIPTRLLDWTESSLVALFFAINNMHEDSDAAVWILHPWDLNRETIKHQSVPIVTDKIVKKYVSQDEFILNIKAKYPVAVRPLHSTNRIIAQKGQFVIHGSDQNGLNNTRLVKSGNLKLNKIEIDRKFKKNIMKELFMTGITHSVIFPDLDGLSKELFLRYSDDFMI